MEELVVLVDDQNHPIGTLPKSEVHTDHTPLHRGFSVFLFNRHGQLLLQQRAKTKKVWPLIWSNSCCGHPAPDEPALYAAHRRIRDELGLEIRDLYLLIDDFRYETRRDDILEKEICPILVGFIEQEPQPNPDEVNAVEWLDWEAFIEDCKARPDRYSPWCKLEVELLRRHSEFHSFYKEYCTNRRSDD